MRTRVSGAAVFALALCMLPATVAQAATITVANHNDSGPGSLRQAIIDAAAGETIAVPTDTYTLTSGELAIAKSLMIVGGGASETVVRAGGAFRLFNISGAATSVTIRGLTIRDGLVAVPGGVAIAGGVWSREGATLSLEDDVVRNNRAVASGGSGQSGGIAEGGGIWAEGGTLRLVDTSVIANSASAVGGSAKFGGIAEAGGVGSFGTLTVVNTSFIENTADARGGQGLPNNEQSGGIAEAGGFFVGVGAGPAPSMSSTTFHGNVADASGGPGETSGGIAAGGGMFFSTSVAATISGPTASANSARASGGTGAGASGGIAEGGGLFVSSSALTTISNATVSGNGALAPGGSGIAQGGGLFASASKEPLTLTNATLDANTAEAPGATSGGGNLFANNSITKIKNTIVSAGSGPAGKQNCAANGESLGSNIDSRDECAFHAPGDRTNTDPLLSSLGEHGGPVQTEAIGASSPAVDGGSNSGCPGTDARGVIRPQGSSCDVGAFELAPPSATTSPATAVGTTSATLQGVALNPDPLGGSAFFQFGTTSSYGTQTPAQALPGFAVQPFSATQTGLTPGTVYHFRAVATNVAGTAFGADQTFTSATPAKAKGPPTLAGLAVRPSSFRAERGKGASIRSTRKARGATVSYSDSQAATTTFTVLSRRTGYRVGRRCQAKAPKHHRGKLRRCVRYVSVGSFTHADRSGTNRLHFTGRVKRKPLPLGRYRLRAVARNAGGQLSRALLTDFRVIR